eukprot:420674-Amphidinium_carterae.1
MPRQICPQALQSCHQPWRRVACARCRVFLACDRACLNPLLWRKRQNSDTTQIEAKLRPMPNSGAITMLLLHEELLQCVVVSAT